MTTQRPDELFQNINGEFLSRDAWQDFTPTVTQSVSVTLTITFARYVVLANTVIVQARLAITSAGTGNNAIVIGGLPTVILPTNSPSSEHVVGSAIVNNTGSALYHGALVNNAAASFIMVAHNVTGGIGNDPNFALADGDFIGFQGSWER